MSLVEWITLIGVLTSIVMAIGAIYAVMQGKRQNERDQRSEGEAKGRLMQRLETIEKTIENIGVRLACVEDGHSDSKTQFATLNERLRGMDEKLNTIMSVLERRTRQRDGE